MTREPSEAIFNAQALPMPEPAPVTSGTLSFRSIRVSIRLASADPLQNLAGSVAFATAFTFDDACAAACAAHVFANAGGIGRSLVAWLGGCFIGLHVGLLRIRQYPAGVQVTFPSGHREPAR